jgi:hypothetical protein
MALRRDRCCEATLQVSIQWRRFIGAAPKVSGAAVGWTPLNLGGGGVGVVNVV